MLIDFSVGRPSEGYFPCITCCSLPFEHGGAFSAFGGAGGGEGDGNMNSVATSASRLLLSPPAAKSCDKRPWWNAAVWFYGDVGHAL